MAAQDHLNASLVIGQAAVGEFEEALRCGNVVERRFVFVVGESWGGGPRVDGSI